MIFYRFFRTHKIRCHLCEFQNYHFFAGNFKYHFAILIGLSEIDRVLVQCWFVDAFISMREKKCWSETIYCLVENFKWWKPKSSAGSRYQNEFCAVQLWQNFKEFLSFHWTFFPFLSQISEFKPVFFSNQSNRLDRNWIPNRHLLCVLICNLLSCCWLRLQDNNILQFN